MIQYYSLLFIRVLSRAARLAVRAGPAVEAVGVRHAVLEVLAVGVRVDLPGSM